MEFLYGTTKPIFLNKHLCKYTYIAGSKPCYYDPNNKEYSQKIACLPMMLDPLYIVLKVQIMAVLA